MGRKGCGVMETCQYEFQFENEFMGILEMRIGALLDIPINQESMVRADRDQQSFILWKKNDNNFMLFSANLSTYMYLLIVQCDKKYEEKLRDILLEICDNIEEDYDEDHRGEVKDVFKKTDTWFLRLEEKYQITELLHMI